MALLALTTRECQSASVMYGWGSQLSTPGRANSCGDGLVPERGQFCAFLPDREDLFLIGVYQTLEFPLRKMF
ncbi:MAG TPA: hypothetical protein DCL54_07670 [Alphaproteobacteria bacterium]|nr:hypothetical protein [Alphaproteobacteria bacterium]